MADVACICNLVQEGDLHLYSSVLDMHDACRSWLLRSAHAWALMTAQQLPGVRIGLRLLSVARID